MKHTARFFCWATKPRQAGEFTTATTLRMWVLFARQVGLGLGLGRGTDQLEKPVRIAFLSDLKGNSTSKHRLGCWIAFEVPGCGAGTSDIRCLEKSQ